MDEKNYQEEVQETNPLEDYFKVQSGDAWMNQAANIPIKKKLAGELWFEGENAVLFADSNSGKSILAVQIADSISRGEALSPLELTAEPQPVVYFDFEMEAPQFYARYSNNGQDPYKWDRNFIRVEINEDAMAPKGNFSQFICDAIEVVMLRTGARVGIIDNISYLNDELEKSKAAAPLIKQIKSRNARYVFDKDNVLMCRIIKDNNFLRFEFCGEEMEIDHLENPDPMPKDKIIDIIKRDYPKGRSARSIAERVGYSHTTINKIIAELIRDGELKERGSGNLPSVTEFLKVTEVSTISTNEKVETTEKSEDTALSIPEAENEPKNEV